MLLVHMINSRISNPFVSQPGSLAGTLQTTGLLCPRTDPHPLFLMHSLLIRKKYFIKGISHEHAQTYRKMHTHTHNIVPQIWHVVICGLSDAAAQQGPLGLSMQLCGEMDQHWFSKGFGNTPHVVSWMVAPSLQSPNVHIWLQSSCAMLTERKVFSLTPYSLVFHLMR